MIQPSASNIQAVRLMFFINSVSKIKAIIYYPLSLRRNFDEINSVIIALQKADADNCITPMNWRPGNDVIITTAGSYSTVKERVESNNPDMYCLDWFMCLRREKPLQ